MSDNGIMNTHDPDFLLFHQQSIFKGSTEITFYVFGVCFGSMGIKYSMSSARYASLLTLQGRQ
jgi:spore maturation protein SpmB